MSHFTTNEEDQREAKKLQARLQKSTENDDDENETTTTNSAAATASYQNIPSVTLAEGAHKYVLITAFLPNNSNERQHFVVSKRNAAYHRNVAEPFVELLERNGYRAINIKGGGRIALDTVTKSISIYGYSYGFGLADHALSKSIVDKDPNWEGYEVTWSNEGY